MIGVVVFTVVAVAFAVGYNKFKSMRKCDFLSSSITVLTKLGISRFGALIMPSPKCREVTASNGQKLHVGNPTFESTMDAVLKFKTRDDDVFIATYPKAGTTWMQTIVWLICNNADVETSKKLSLPERSPFLEAVDIPPFLRGIQTLESWPENKQRVIKTHRPFGLLPEEVGNDKKCKIIYVARNPKDCCVSYYHFHKKSGQMFENPGTWSEFLSKFASGNIECSSWFDHNLKYWEEYRKNKEQIYFVTYESLKKDLRSGVTGISKFLQKELSEKQVDDIVNQCSFESMSKDINPAFKKAGIAFGADFSKSKFLRKGQVGDWKNYFTLNENETFDKLYKEKMKDSGLDFIFELD